MSFLIFLLQFDWNKLRPENLFGQQILERTPAGLSLIYMAGIALLLLLLLLSFIRNLRPKFAFEVGLPKAVTRKLSRTQTNRSLRIFQAVFALLTFTVFGFHVYWTMFAEKDNERFIELSNKDLRVRRSSTTALRGWMLDRSGKLADALAYYKKDKEGNIERTYALDKELSHLLGTELGSPGLERTLYKPKVEPMPEAWEVLTRVKKPEDEQNDVRITIDRELQTFAAKELEGKKGAIVVLNPQTGDVLAVYSNPTYALSQVNTAEDMHKLERDQMNKPLVSRATREYYVPGSTFKTFTMIGAFRARLQDSMFESTAVGYEPFRGSRTITDANRGCEPPYGCITLNIQQAFEASSNQYFSRMAVEIGSEKMAITARLVGIDPVDDRADALNRPFQKDIWNASNDRIKGALALRQSTIVTGKIGDKFSKYDLAIQGMGQGLAGQMTPFQMALIAAAAGNLQGNLMKPKIEADLQPQLHNNIMTSQEAETVRQIMLSVTRGSGGTAKNVAAIVGSEIMVGGKTGTAQKEVPKYKADGTPETYTVKKRNRQTGEVKEVTRIRKFTRIDGWFIALAPLDNPQVAIAVVVENIGGSSGGKTAGPIAANIIVKARQLGLLGERYKPKANVPNKRGGSR
jgi:hypothetical protein